MESKAGVIAPKLPCGTGELDTWGCNRFVEDQGLDVVTVTVPMDYVLEDLAGGLVIKGQQQLCS